MSSEQWDLLERIQENLNHISDLPPEIMFVIADHIEEAISTSSHTSFKAFSSQLAGLFNQLLRIAPIDTVNAIRQSMPSDTSEYAAYTLGQISFAQLLAAHTSERRANDDFMTTIRDNRYKKYIKALYLKDYTGVDLINISNECAETVSRKLKRLRELGITDFRREGNRISNFLTPAARSVMKEIEIAEENEMQPTSTPNQSIKLLTKSVPKEFQRQPTFGINKRNLQLEAA